MMGKSVFYLLFFFTRAILLNAQDYSFTHYDKQEGMAGSIAYGMTQDKDGFIWIGTETGLSRFDGSRFVNFSTLDGLPDNEILNVFGDSKGRVWIMPFRVSICYYYKGKFYTNENDSLLSKIKLVTHAAYVSEDAEGNILIQEFGKNCYLITADGQVDHFTPDSAKQNFVQSHRRKEGGFWVQQGKCLYVLEKRKMTHIADLKFPAQHYFNAALLADQMAWRINGREVAVAYLQRNQVIQKSLFPDKKGRVSMIDKGTLAFCTREGAYVYRLGQNRSPQVFLANKSINAIFIDDEKNWWFCTYGAGIYRLNSETVRNISFSNGADRNHAITAVARKGEKIFAGSDDGRIYTFDFRNDTLFKSTVIPYPDKTSSPIIDLSVGEDGNIVYGSLVSVVQLDSSYRVKASRYSTSTKKISDAANGEVLVSTGVNAVRMNLNHNRVVDTIWNGRTTTVFQKGDTIYLGTLAGLFCIYADKRTEFLGDHIPLLRTRIISISQTANGNLWVATYGNGVIGLRNNQLVEHFSGEDGLKSNICRTTATHGNDLWIGTDKGLSKINTADRKIPITNYSSADGLSHETVNAIATTDSMIFVGTYGGLTYFKEKLLTQESSCRLRITGIFVNYNMISPDTAGLTLDHDQNSIRVDYVGISFRSQGDVEYKYRLLGLDTTWQHTREMSLNYHSLPSGRYLLQMQAINRYGVSSSLVNIPFAIIGTVWEKTWVRALLSLLFLLFIVLVTMMVSRQIKKREDRKNRINMRITELEQLALKSQMNPHFIFNSLNSIQQYVMDKDIAGANKFISDFSRLIRQTLDFSSRPFVPLADEISYLRTYLELEKTRLEGKFDYKIDLAPELKEGAFPIPPMIIQPYVENSIRHGVKYRKDDRGLIQVKVNRKNRYIVVVIEDNGIGRKMAAYYKTSNPIEYQSKGMSLTADRIELINRNRSSKITVLIEDMVDSSLEPLGTRVTINFPE